MYDFDIYYLLALRYLNIRFRSEKEIRDYLRKKLFKKGQDEKIKEDIEQLIDLIIHKLKQQKFLNDEEFAKMWIRSRTDFKPKGERLIRLELRQKGINKEIIDKAFQAFDVAQLDNNEEKRDELSLAKAILEKKRKKFEPMERQERFNKAGNLLARRGFDLDEIKAAIDAVFGK
jgi:regulatory protein